MVQGLDFIIRVQLDDKHGRLPVMSTVPFLPVITAPYKSHLEIKFNFLECTLVLCYFCWPASEWDCLDNMIFLCCKFKPCPLRSPLPLLIMQPGDCGTRRKTQDNSQSINQLAATTARATARATHRSAKVQKAQKRLVTQRSEAAKMLTAVAQLLL